MHTQTSIGFGLRLKLAREEAKMSGTDLGRNLQPDGKDASRATISDWEKERHYPNVWQLRAICTKLTKSADYFLFGDIKPVSQSLARAKAVVDQLTDEERLALFASIHQEAVSDATLEARMPITKKRPSSVGKSGKHK
jgi:transcriptional regulator with XRE-family HTH domain